MAKGAVAAVRVSTDTREICSLQKFCPRAKYLYLNRNKIRRTEGCYFNFFFTAILCFQIDGKTKKVKKIDTKFSSAPKSDGKIELMKSSIHPTQPVADKSVDFSQTSVTAKIEIDNCSSEPHWLPCGSTIEPITKPPHLRSKVSLTYNFFHVLNHILP